MSIVTRTETEDGVVYTTAEGVQFTVKKLANGGIDIRITAANTAAALAAGIVNTWQEIVAMHDEQNTIVTEF